MKLLMTSNILFPSIAKKCNISASTGGGWLTADVEALSDQYPNLKIGVLTVHPSASQGCYQEGSTSHFVVKGSSSTLTRWPNNYLLREFNNVVNKFNPDVLYVQGTEYNYGLTLSTVAPDIPSVVAIQGLITTCRAAEKNCLNIITQLRYRTAIDWIDWLLYRGPMQRRQSKLEIDSISRFKHILGRTQWTKAYARKFAPNAKYYHVDRVMRPEFSDLKWCSDESERYSIFSSTGLIPRKGLHVLLEAVSLIKNDYESIKVRIPGAQFKGIRKKSKLGRSGYENYLWQLIKKNNLEHIVEGLGPLDALGMAKELKRANVFIMPSYIENASTSLCEAMLIGTPSIVSYVGGMGTISHDHSDALMFPVGEAVLLAEQIRTLFDNKKMCEGLSNNARLKAIRRHSPKKIAESLMSIFKKISK